MLDASALWAWSPRAQFRVSASNVLARDYLSGGTRWSGAGAQATRDTTQSTAPSYLNLQAKLELKL